MLLEQGLGMLLGAALNGSSAEGRVPSRGLRRTEGGKLSGPPRWQPLWWLSGVPGGGGSPQSLSRCLPHGLFPEVFLPGVSCCVWAFRPSPLPSRTDWCLSLPGSSEIGLTSGITFPFLGNIFLETPTYPVTNWCMWRRGRFPKKGKEMSQMQAEVKWAQGSLTDKWA